jgi:putative PIN family toxin of toxin-antitoxin system
MNVIIDTNIFVSAVLSQNGFAVDIIRLALQKKIKPQIGLKLFQEYEDVLSRKKILSESRLTFSEIDELLNSLLFVSKWNDIYYLWRPNLVDEGDNHIVELAVASNAKYIITHNKKDFLLNQLNFNFEVVTAQEFFDKEKFK